MTQTLTAVLALAAAPLFAPSSPCFRVIGPGHIPALLSAGPSELEIQTGCLVLEYSVSPRAEFIPPPTPLVVGTPPVIAVRAVPGMSRPTFSEPFARSSFGLGSASLAYGPRPK